MPETPSEIFYVLGDNLEATRRSAHLDYFNENGIEVLLLHEPIDSFLMTALREFEGKKLRNVDDANLHDSDAEAAEGALSPALIGQLGDRVKTILGSERISDVRASNRLRSNPVRLVTSSDDGGRDMDRIRRMLGQEYTVPTRIMELNPTHPIIHNLAAMLDDPEQSTLLDLSIEQLYGAALLGEGLHPNPSELVSGIYALIGSATKK